MGRKIRTPTVAAPTLAIRTAAADKSFASLASKCQLGDAKSTKRSIAELMASKAITIAMHKAINDHSKLLILDALRK